MGNKIKVENEALADAESVRIRAEAEKTRMIREAEGKAKAMEIVGLALKEEEGKNAASLELAKQFIKEFGKICENSNSIIVPENVSDISSFISKALAVVKFNDNENKNKKEK